MWLPSQTSTSGLILCSSQQKAHVNYIKPGSKHTVHIVPNTFIFQERFGYAFLWAFMYDLLYFPFLTFFFLMLHTSDGVSLTAPAAFVRFAFSFFFFFAHASLPSFPLFPSRLRKQNKHPILSSTSVLQRWVLCVCVCVCVEVRTVGWGAKSLLSSRKDDVSSHSEGSGQKKSKPGVGWGHLACVCLCVWVEGPKSLWLMWVCNPFTQPPFFFYIVCPHCPDGQWGE